MKLPRPILDEFRRNKIKLEYGYMGHTKDFHIRVITSDIDQKYLQEGDKRWTIQFAYRPTFDRWANSTNFETDIHYCPFIYNVDSTGIVVKKRRTKQYTIPKLDKELAWCLKCAKSEVFNFNAYFYTIKTPWFIF
jgi:hypothetical protein